MPRLILSPRGARPTPAAPRARWLWDPRTTPLRSPVLLALGLAALILAGTLLLLLPISAREGRADVVVALFTATSAVTVTGLVVVDTRTYWSPFGQAIILALFQFGGLGFMLGVTALGLLLRGRLSIKQRVIVQEIGVGPSLGGQSRLVRNTFLFTFGSEAVGILLLWPRFASEYGVGRGLWLAVFHGVSAFTNAGFDVFGDSLVGFRADPFVLLTVAALIVLGALSLVVVGDVWRHRRWSRLSLDSKIVLLGTAVLLVGATVITLITERANPASIGGLPAGLRLLNAFFAAASRTAGFVTWDFAASDQRTTFFFLGLMFVGGAPGSMAGGIKITTAVLILAGVWSTLRGRPDATLLERRLPPSQLAQAHAVVILALALVANMALAISLLDGARLLAPFLSLLFEVTSAFGTVGFSAGVTPQLSTPGRVLLILTMFAGRLGPITVALTLVARRQRQPYRRISEGVRIG
ncbi:MAG: KtrAB potassium uptake system, integral membrane component KtrB [uncultured Thermomicrobiales bacterium]|uniref:KtrAB potassium uptake system, integral membrane component KtrB n=1 Tax=uncultured Thermomicrobiales bacterium TaxID=1645740 RepID=A0A6J4VHT5_9BACT|nr:MAG: KtrAB potassium uptake system, integral membrane component KtrB [uncultured Thermomicrobiales bacterium]